MTVTINGTTGVTFPDASVQNTAATGFGFKNRIINGAMMIDQRNAGAAVTTNLAFPVDRFFVSVNNDGAYSAQQSTTAPAGFINSLKWTTTTADSSLAAGQYAGLVHRIEGNNIADFGWGTANAQTVTLSFWTRSSLTGTFSGAFVNSATNRSYAFTYTISTADTWEYKTITIAGDTSGTWLTNNGIGVSIIFSMGAGSTYSGTAGSWSGNFYLAATGSTSVIGTLNATFYVTGVQLEKGSTATSFDYRPYGTELALCQRYFEKSAPQGTSITANNAGGLFPVYPATIPNGVYYAWVKFAVPKRATPTITTYPYSTATNTTRFSNDGGGDFAANSATVGGQQETMFSISNSSGSSITTGASSAVIGSWYASAEL